MALTSDKAPTTLATLCGQYGGSFLFSNTIGVSMQETSISRLSVWDSSLAALTSNVKATYRKLRKDGTIGISRANLRQIVSTQGVNVPPSAFDRLLDQAIDRAELPKGFVR